MERNIEENLFYEIMANLQEAYNGVIEKYKEQHCFTNYDYMFLMATLVHRELTYIEKYTEKNKEGDLNGEMLIITFNHMLKSLQGLIKAEPIEEVAH